jgi:CubicO group peptidase (beta-lactamase class C family)
MTARRTFATVVLVGVWLSVAVSVRVQTPALAPDLRDRLDGMAAAELAKDGIGGATVGVVAGGALAWAKGYGLADIAAKTPATVDTVYRIGSITKPFTALMLLQLVEAGRVHLSDPVEKYLPEINRIEGRAPDAPPVTLIELATMTSGIAREPEDLPAFLQGPVSEWERVMVAALAKTHYAYEPGTRYLYSNIGYAILGGALGRAAGEPYVDYVRAHILKPLDMSHTDFVPNATIRPTLASGYEVRDGTPDGTEPAREHDGRGYKVPNGALYTTVGDLARYASLMLGEGPEIVLKQATVADNRSRISSATGDLTSGYGIGFQVERRGELVLYGHGGSVAGYRAQILYEPKTRTGVIVLRNVGGGRFNVTDLCLRLLEAVVAAQ